MGERIAAFASAPPRVERTEAFTLRAMQISTLALYEEVARG
jgi:hypothetical protein